MKANVVLNPAFPQREGTNATGQKGKLLHQAIIDTAETKGVGMGRLLVPEARTN
jgi:cytochrome c